eukprot:TCONS_00027182-protein
MRHLVFYMALFCMMLQSTFGKAIPGHSKEDFSISDKQEFPVPSIMKEQMDLKNEFLADKTGSSGKREPELPKTFGSNNDNGKPLQMRIKRKTKLNHLVVLVNKVLADTQKFLNQKRQTVNNGNPTEKAEPEMEPIVDNPIPRYGIDSAGEFNVPGAESSDGFSNYQGNDNDPTVNEPIVDDPVSKYDIDTTGEINDPYPEDYGLPDGQENSDEGDTSVDATMNAIREDDLKTIDKNDPGAINNVETEQDSSIGNDTADEEEEESDQINEEESNEVEEDVIENDNYSNDEDSSANQDTGEGDYNDQINEEETKEDNEDSEQDKRDTYISDGDEIEQTDQDIAQEGGEGNMNVMENSDQEESNTYASDEDEIAQTAQDIAEEGDEGGLNAVEKINDKTVKDDDIGDSAAVEEESDGMTQKSQDIVQEGEEEGGLSAVEKINDKTVEDDVIGDSDAVEK